MFLIYYIVFIRSTSSDTAKISISSAQTVFEPANLAWVSREHYKLVILIESGSEYADRRESVRRTWLERLQEINKERRFVEETQILYMFVCMEPGDEEGRGSMLSEARGTQDMVMFHIYDHYNNLVLLTVSAIDWAHYHFSYDYLLKTDDDSLLNLDNILRSLERIGKDGFMGQEISNGLHFHYSEKKQRWMTGRMAARYKSEQIIPYYQGPFTSFSGKINGAGARRIMANIGDSTKFA